MFVPFPSGKRKEKEAAPQLKSSKVSFDFAEAVSSFDEL